MKIKILGSTASIPDVNNDAPCYLVNDEFLFDCGFNVLSDLRETDCDLSKIKYICFTHMHHDHYLGLPALLFYFIHSRIVDIGDLTIIGPKQELKEVLEYTYEFLQLKKYYSSQKLPAVKELEEGDEFSLGDIDFVIGEGHHTAPSVSYILTEKDSGKKLGIAGDTRYNQNNAKFFFGCDALVHDATLNYEDEEILNDRPSGHSTIFEAVLISEKAKVKKLFPMHMSVEKANSSVEFIKNKTEVEVISPERGKEYEI